MEKNIQGKKISEMSNNEKLEYLYSLLPDSQEEDEKELYMDSLKKLCFYTTKKGQPIGERIKKINFDIGKFSKREEFLFWLTYIVLTHTTRGVLNKDLGERQSDTSNSDNRQGYPNQKLVYYIERINVDMDAKSLVIFFLIIGDTLCKMRKDNSYDEEYAENDFVKAFTDQLIFQHRYYEYTYSVKINRNHIGLSEEEIEILNAQANIYEKAYKEKYDGEERQLRKYLLCIHKLPKKLKLKGFDNLMQKEYLSFFNDDELNMDDLVLFNYLFSIRFLAMASEILYFDIYVRESSSSISYNLKRIREYCKSFINELSQKRDEIKKQLSINIFTKFASVIVMLSDKKEYHYTFDVLEKLDNQFATERGTSIVKSDEFDDKIFSEKLIDDEKTGKLLDYFIPNKGMRKASDRNGIRDRLKYTKKVLEYLSEKYSHCENVQKGSELKLMYQELYMCEKIEGEKKTFGALARDLYNGKKTDIKKSQFIMLKEKYIRGIFRDEGKRDVYFSFVQDRKEILKSAEQLLSILEDD